MQLADASASRMLPKVRWMAWTRRTPIMALDSADKVGYYDRILYL
jgi:hypothetical protein